MIAFSTLLGMYQDKSLSKEGLDKYVRKSAKPPVISTVKRAVDDGIIPEKLAKSWIDDGILPEGSTRSGSKPASGFIDNAGNQCIPSFYMKGSSRSSENWSEAMVKFKEDYVKLVQTYIDNGHIVDFD